MNTPKRAPKGPHATPGASPAPTPATPAITPVTPVRIPRAQVEGAVEMARMMLPPDTGVVRLCDTLLKAKAITVIIDGRSFSMVLE